MRMKTLLDSLTLDPADPKPLKRQLYEGIRRLIVDRALKSGSELPSTRMLSRDLSVSRNTVIAAYEQLTTEGYVRNHETSRLVVVDLPQGPIPHDDARAEVYRPTISERGHLISGQPFHQGAAGHSAFHPGMPDVPDFPFTSWSRLVARRAASNSDTLFGFYDVLGVPLLREAIATYLNAARGLRCSPEQVVITTGAQAAFDMLSRVLLDPGDTVWMEEPGYYGAHGAFLAAGARLAPLPVTEDGWSLDAMPDRPVKAIYVTPSCHHPLGATMRMEQRLRLLEIAERFNAWVIEDDYDSEFRFNGQPVPAMQGADHSRRVIYVGTFSKMLFPALRIGFMVVPLALTQPLTQAICACGHIAPLLLQAALADFIQEGHLSKHLRRMRRLYAARRDVFLEMCRSELSPWLQLVPSQSGIQTTGLFTRPLDDKTVATAAQKRGIMVSPLSIQYRHGNPRHGLLLGYASTSTRTMARHIEKLKTAFEEVQSTATNGRSPP